ncbi:MAG: DUF483 domain-containing protein [Deltaproteobacteria bacterium]|nr:DUF483 domain-containing protein [Deltaproteobacteria bacterium]
MFYHRNFYYSKNYRNISGDIQKIIATEKGLKPLSILRISLEEDLGFLKSICSRKGLIFYLSAYDIEDRCSCEEEEEESLGTNAQKKIFYVYIARDRKVLQWVQENVYKFRPKHSEKYALEFGRLLGYPRCCVESYLSHGKVDYFSHSRINEIPYLNNNLFVGSVSNAYLSNHLYCSYGCKPSLMYAKKLLKYIADQEGELARFITSMLKAPLLIRINSFGKNKFLSVLEGVCFEGEIIGSSLRYSNISLIAPVLSKNSSLSFQNIIDFLAKGDSLFFDDQYIFIRRGSRLLKKVARNNLCIIKPV